MPEVSFYLLNSSSPGERLHFACRLIEKAYRNGQYCYVLTESEPQAGQIDKLLWSFRAGSFVPHQLYRGDLPDYPHTVLIGNEPIPEAWRPVIVNLSQAVPPLAEPTQRILEILDADESVKRAGRQRYRLYREAGCRLDTHRID